MAEDVQDGCLFGIWVTQVPKLLVTVCHVLYKMNKKQTIVDLLEAILYR